MAQAISHFRLDGPPYRLRLHQFRQKDYLDVGIRKSARLVEIDVGFTDAGEAYEGRDYRNASPTCGPGFSSIRSLPRFLA